MLAPGTPAPPARSVLLVLYPTSSACRVVTVHSAAFGLQVYDILETSLETELSTIVSLLDTAQQKLNMAVRDIGSGPFQKCVEAMAKHANEAQIAVFELEEERCIVGYPRTTTSRYNRRGLRHMYGASNPSVHRSQPTRHDE